MLYIYHISVSKMVLIGVEFNNVYMSAINCSYESRYSAFTIKVSLTLSLLLLCYFWHNIFWANYFSCNFKYL